MQILKNLNRTQLANICMQTCKICRFPKNTEIFKLLCKALGIEDEMTLSNSIIINVCTNDVIDSIMGCWEHRLKITSPEVRKSAQSYMIIYKTFTQPRTQFERYIGDIRITNAIHTSLQLIQ